MLTQEEEKNFMTETTYTAYKLNTDEKKNLEVAKFLKEIVQ